MNPVRRVEQLIALATDPAVSQEEARTAAIAAAKAIRSNGLIVTPPGGYLEQPAPQNERLLSGGRGLQPAPARRGVGQLPEDTRMGGMSYLDLDFEDAPPAKIGDFAFPQALLALLGRQ
jgi:hypothetical protein